MDLPATLILVLAWFAQKKKKEKRKSARQNKCFRMEKKTKKGGAVQF